METTEATVLAPSTSHRNAPWIGIGKSGEWHSVLDALVANDMNFDVRECTVAAWTPYVDKDGNEVPGVGKSINLPELKAIQRLDTKEILGTVSNRYHPVLNRDAFGMLNPLLAAGGVITNAGITVQGLNFMIVRMRETEINGELYDFDVMATNSFNGAFSVSMIFSPIRIICQNMYRKLMGASDNIMRFKHGTSAQEKLEEGRIAVAALTSCGSAFSLEVQKLQAMTAFYNQEEFAEMLFPYRDWSKAGNPVQLKERVDFQRKMWIDQYFDAVDNRQYHGSCFGLVNSYYDYLSHGVPTKIVGDVEHRRLSNLASGQAVRPKLLQAACKSI